MTDPSTRARRTGTDPWAEADQHQALLRQKKYDAVLSAAAAAFARNGTSGTSMDDLAAALGVTKPTLYKTVGDKDAIIRACEDRMLASYRKLLENTRNHSGTYLDQMAYYLRNSVHLLVEDEFGKLLNPLSHPNIYGSSSPRLRDFREEVEALFRQLITEGIAKGEFRPDLDAKIVTLSLFASFNFIPRWYQENGTLSLDEIVDRHLQLFSYALLV